MRIRRFNESDKIETLKDVFDNLDVYFDVNVEYKYSGSDFIWSDRVPNKPREILGNVRFMTVSIELYEDLSKDLLQKIVELVNMSISYCGVKFERWDIIGPTRSIIQSSKEIVYDDGVSKLKSKGLDSIVDFYQEKVKEIEIQFKEEIINKYIL